MNDKKRILIVAQEFAPYLELSEFSEITRQLALNCHKEGYEIRCIMPKFDVINERRHRLHNVVRLSGIYTNVTGIDYPMHIKVASLPNARLQVYFLENDLLFKRGEIFHDDEGNWLETNDLRTIFFCKSVLETVKKFGWPPDLIICFHWISSLIPFYIKTLYHREAVFSNAKIVYGLTPDTDMKRFKSTFFKNILHDNISEEKLEIFKPGSHLSLINGAVKYSDAVLAIKDNYEQQELDSVRTIVKKKTNIIIDDGNSLQYEKSMKIIEKLTDIS